MSDLDWFAFRLVWFGFVWFGLAFLCSVVTRFGLVLSRLDSFCVVSLVFNCLGLLWYGTDSFFSVSHQIFSVVLFRTDWIGFCFFPWCSPGLVWFCLFCIGLVFMLSVSTWFGLVSFG